MRFPADIENALIRTCLALILYPGIILLIWGCSDERTISQLPGAHPVLWMEPQSPDFHGTVMMQNGSRSCAVCHGEDFRGGRVGISCVDCHLTSGACTACHGGRDNNTGAPPDGLHSEIDDTTLAVGAHTVHLSGSGWAAAVTCQSCHLVPASMFESFHLDTGATAPDSVAEITWQGYADGGGAVWDRPARTCSGTYCHGNFDGGYGSNTPVWTARGQAECGSCHDAGTNPGDLGLIHQLHLTPDGLVCADCHSGVVDSSLAIVTPALHVNGVTDVLAPEQARCEECHGTGPDACTHCHGGADNLTGAPPRGLRGETSETTLAVGAHTTHMEVSYIADAFSCDECHLVPVRLSDPGHWDIDSTAEITWGELAGGTSQWDRSSGECSNTYCHGNFSGGYPANTPIWIAPGQAPCGSCHDDGTNPGDLSGRHRKHVREEKVTCSECHSATVDAGLAIIGKSVHVDGHKTVAFGTRQITYQNGTCSGPGACHEPEDWQ
ncbi:MAG: CxxxxCH/CxxCH domain-containing protein [candidate division Zixibacteria bacterium]|nr:CxxxxCH/CxxCH domain-containing protein [candidate division Zixibacteria bacterium]